MQITAVFNHPEDNKHWRLFTHCEELAQFVQDTSAVLHCVKNNDYNMLESDLANLHERASALLAAINKDSV